MSNYSFRIKKSGWMYLFLGVVLLATISGMIAYQYLRQDPVKIIFKNAQGYTTTQVVFKHPNETVGQVLQKTTTTTDKYVCDIDLNEQINAIDTLTLVEKVSGNINVDGTVIPFNSGANTIKEVLSENEITISPVDVVVPSLNDELTVNSNNINIQRGTNLVETKTEVLPFQSQLVQNDNAPLNQTKVLQAGENGVRTYTKEDVYSNGVLVDSIITSEEIKDPVPEIIEVGTNVEVGKPNIEKGDIEAWTPYVIKALEKNGLSTSEDMINKVLRQINTESAGDQNAHQEIIDMNSFIGEEARGLMQTTPYTFNAYHFEGYNDILNGYHNLLAALNYAKQMYGEDLAGLGEGHGY